MLEVRIKRNITEGMTQETENQGILLHNELVQGSTYPLLTTHLEDYNTLAVKVGNKAIPIALDWITSFSRGTTTYSCRNKIKMKDNKVITDKYHINVVTEEIVHKDDIQVCSCGEEKVATVKGEHYCSSCLLETYYNIENYSHKPTPTFYGEQIKKDKANPIHFGIELEYGVNDKVKFATAMADFNDRLYFKSDSSITSGNEGSVELVTHPHTYLDLMDKGSWVDSLKDLDVNDYPESNGCHIHISRTSFVDDTHYALFYFLLHKDVSLVTFIGGRELTEYCGNNINGDIVTKTKEDRGGKKYSMLNEKNSATVEARYMASTNDPDTLRTYIQFLESMIKYTKYNSRKASLSGWVSYVKKYSKKYELLLSKLSAFKGDLKGKSVTKTKLRLKATKIGKLNISDFSKVYSITDTDGHKFTNIGEVKISRDYIEFYSSKDGWRERSFSNIKEVEVRVGE